MEALIQLRRNWLVLSKDLEFPGVFVCIIGVSRLAAMVLRYWYTDFAVLTLCGRPDSFTCATPYTCCSDPSDVGSLILVVQPGRKHEDKDLVDVVWVVSVGGK